MQRSITFFLIGSAALLVASIAGMALIITNLDPKVFANVVYFYLGIFVLSSSLTFLIGFFVRRSFGAREFAQSHLKTSLRQSVWFAVLIIACFILLSNNLFSIWNALLLSLSLTFLESYFLFK